MYTPYPVPQTADDLPRYLQHEFERLRDALTVVTASRIAFLHNAPLRPREGDVVGADGTDWNPGSGQGVYCFYNNVWNYLG